MSRIYFAAMLLIGSLSFVSSVKAAEVPGDPCLSYSVGTTILSSDHVNILACLQQTPDASATRVWKNYTPDNDDANGTKCQEGSLAIYTGGRFVCKSDGICNNGDLVVYRGGRFVCEGEDKTAVLKNYSVNYMPMKHNAPSWDGTPYYGNLATAWFLGDYIYDHDVPLYSGTYKAQSTGMARISVTAPFRYYQDTSYWDTAGVHTEWETSVPIEVDIKDSHGNFVGGRWYGYGFVEDLSNPSWSTDGSSGDVSKTVEVFPITKGETYSILVKVKQYGNGGVDWYGWAGTQWMDDHYTAGSVELVEY